MAKQNSFSSTETSRIQTDDVVNHDVPAAAKKQFVEPEISTPVDVLEATTFFQTTTSGGTNT